MCHSSFQQRGDGCTGACATGCYWRSKITTALSGSKNWCWVGTRPWMYRLEQVLSLYMNIKIWQVWANWRVFCFSWAAIVCAPQVEEQALQLLCPAPPPLPTSYLLVGFPSCRSSSMACPSLLFWTWPKLAELILRNLGSDNFWMESFLLVRVALWLGFWTNVASELSWRYFLAGQPGRRLQEHEVHWHLSTYFWCQVPINEGTKIIKDHEAHGNIAQMSSHRLFRSDGGVCR